MKLSHVLFFAVSNEKGRAFSRLETATKLEYLKIMKICDILNPSSHGIADDSCYVAKFLAPLNIV